MNTNYSHIKKCFYNSEQEIRIIWPLIFLITAILLGEFLIVRPATTILLKAGLAEVTTVLPQNWKEATGDSIKRILRIAIVLTSAIMVVKFVLKKQLTFLGLTFNRKLFTHIFLGIALGFLVQLVSIILMAMMGWYHISGFAWQFDSHVLLLPAILYSLVFCLETGVIEETFFRAYLLNIFRHRYTATLGIIVSSLFFGIAHFSGFHAEFAWWMSVISSLAAGFLFAQAYLIYNSLWLPIGLHAGWHLAMRVLGSTGLNPDEAIFLATRVDGPALLVSTKAGGAGLFELVGLMVVSTILLLIKLRRNKIQLQ